jgi:hypothetical protein
MNFRKHLLPFIGIAIHALVLTYACYVFGNIPYSFGSEKQSVKWINVLSGWAFNKKYPAPEDILAINVSYDKQLVEVFDEFDLPLGVVDITDRSKLYNLLSAIDSVGGYKYIMCDILLSEEYRTPADSSLFRLISDMPRISIAGGHDLLQIPEQIRHKAYLSGYSTTIEDSDFVKYPLMTHGQESLPLHMWKSLTNEDVKGSVFGCVSDGRLCRKSIFLNFPVRISELYAIPEQKAWLNLGTDILQVSQMLDLEKMFENKIILIGSFTEDDIHSTIAGDMPGIMINYNAYHALTAGDHKVNIFALIILYLIFYIVTFMIVRRLSLIDIIPIRFRPKSNLFRLVISWLSLSTLLSFVFFLIYILFGEVFDIFFISGYFTLLCMLRK